MPVLCCDEGRLWCCVLVEVLEGGSFMCKGGPKGVWVVFVGVGLCVKGGFVALGCGVVEVGWGGRVVVHPMLWRLCGGCWVIVVAGGVYWKRLRQNVGPEVAEWAEFLCDVELGSVGVPSFS